MTNRVNISLETVKELVSTQFPQFEDLSIKKVKANSWDNYVYHLGDKMLIKLPSAKEYEVQVDKEHQYLPKFSQKLTLQIPHPLYTGKPSSTYPLHWSIYNWIEGSRLSEQKDIDQLQVAKDLADFLNELHKIDAKDGPKAGAHNFYRGGPLKVYDREFQEALDTLKVDVKIDQAQKLWKSALNTYWDKSPLWVHGDLSPDNILAHNGKLKAIIDFGMLGVGDPACDLSIAWTFFNKGASEIFLNELNLSKDVIIRAMGWTLWKALITKAKSQNENSPQIDETINRVFSFYSTVT